MKTEYKKQKSAKTRDFYPCKLLHDQKQKQKHDSRIFDQVFDQIFGQGFDQGSGEGKSHKYSVQYYPSWGNKPLNPLKTLLTP